MTLLQYIIAFMCISLAYLAGFVHGACNVVKVPAPRAPEPEEPALEVDVSPAEFADAVTSLRAPSRPPRARVMPIPPPKPRILGGEVD